MTPIEKNVIVVDEQGNEYEATYPKRAKGLVKNGRARFVGENKICLTCPPNINLEEHKMDNLYVENIGTSAEDTTANETKAGQAPENELTMTYVLARIDKIINDTEHIKSALAAITDIGNNSSHDLGSAGHAKAEAAEAAAEVVQSRETTNQQLIRLLEKMYDDLRPQPIGLSITEFQQMTESLEDYKPEVAEKILSEAVRHMFA